MKAEDRFVKLKEIYDVITEKYDIGDDGLNLVTVLVMGSPLAVDPKTPSILRAMADAMEQLKAFREEVVARDGIYADEDAGTIYDPRVTVSKEEIDLFNMPIDPKKPLN
jgi:hypothetical protein